MAYRNNGLNCIELREKLKIALEEEYEEKRRTRLKVFFLNLFKTPLPCCVVNITTCI